MSDKIIDPKTVDLGLIEKATGIKTFQMVQYVTGYLEGELGDWPANIQDAVLEALERLAQKVELPLTIIHSRCDIDYADEVGGKDRPFVHIIASEIVAADDRFTKVAKDQIKEAIADMMAGRTKH